MTEPLVTLIQGSEFDADSAHVGKPELDSESSNRPVQVVPRGLDPAAHAPGRKALGGRAGGGVWGNGRVRQGIGRGGGGGKGGEV